MPASKYAINRALALEIKAAYVRKGMTAAQVAEKAGFSTGTMTRILAGEDMPVSRLYLIADAIGVAAVDLVRAAVDNAVDDE
ncbi:helix-turn-helix transcriptional regulator [Curtobacterium sp. Csp2]|uniref:helix-turn-helix domain-containing protein n=1 Tax=Curtobacterium TaxID=2034 RepID=UPI00158030D3|nr:MULTISPECIES: helix-turn-helix transcriptional regulator [Curtobacterium]MDK8171712.1 helix-turn-helix transcriptional regulator [Curtobacterium citreum]QKS15730.1 helix-turn-helix transcriptional regulator [Curtobacterium sp. Csp2]